MWKEFSIEEFVMVEENFNEGGARFLAFKKKKTMKKYM